MADTKRKMILLVQSKILVDQRDIFNNPSINEVGWYRAYKIKLNLRPYTFLNFPDNLTFRCAKKVIFQYIENANQLDDYRKYLRKVYEYIKYLNKIEKFGENFINNVNDKQIIKWLRNCTINILSNAEFPLRFLNKEQFEHYLVTFEIEFDKYKYILIKNDFNGKSIKDYFAEIIDNLGIEGDKMFVTNLGKREYINAFIDIYKGRGFPYQAIPNFKGGFHYSFPPLLQDLIINRHSIQMLAHENVDVKDSIKLCKKLNIDISFEYFSDPKTYYTALLCLKQRIPFIVSGPTGSGKTYLINKAIKAIYLNENNVVELNCATLNGELFTSQFYGYKKGAFTGASKDYEGFLGDFKDGIIFLDEISELSKTDQAKILKFLDNKKYFKVGSTREETSNAMLIFATNIDLKEMVEKGKFRSDLYYRITQVQLELPAFNTLGYEKKEMIITEIVNELNKELRINAKESHYRNSEKVLEPEAINYICLNNQWPGNIRELKNVLSKVFKLTNRIQIDSLTIAKYLTSTPKRRLLNPFKIEYKDIQGYGMDDLVKKFKKCVVNAAKTEIKNNCKTAKYLKISEPTFYNILKS